MMIIVEGPDGAGKTTLIESLRRQSGRYFWVLRPSKPPDTREDMLRFLAWIKQRHPLLTVMFDRHPAIGEPIYGWLLRGMNRLKDFDSPAGRAALLKGTHAIVYCRPILPVIEANALRTHQMEGVKEHIGPIVQAYDDMMLELAKNFLVIYYDYNKDSIESVVKRIWHEPHTTGANLPTPEDLGGAVPSDRNPQPGADAPDST